MTLEISSVLLWKAIVKCVSATLISSVIFWTQTERAGSRETGFGVLAVSYITSESTKQAGCCWHNKQGPVLLHCSRDQMRVRWLTVLPETNRTLVKQLVSQLFCFYFLFVCSLIWNIKGLKGFWLLAATIKGNRYRK